MRRNKKVSKTKIQGKERINKLYICQQSCPKYSSSEFSQIILQSSQIDLNIGCPVNFCIYPGLRHSETGIVRFFVKRNL